MDLNDVLSSGLAESLNALEADIMILTHDLDVIFANSSYLTKVNLSLDEVIDSKCYALTHKQKSICHPPADSCPIFAIDEHGNHGMEVHFHKTSSGQVNHVFVGANSFHYDGKKYFLHVASKYIEDKAANKPDFHGIRELLDKALLDVRVNLAKYS